VRKRKGQSRTIPALSEMIAVAEPIEMGEGWGNLREGFVEEPL
jgi:hypothetical protein